MITRDNKKEMKFTAIIERSSDGWFVGQIEEVPEAMSQGRNVEELKEDLEDALKMLWESNRESTEKEYEGKKVIREDLDLCLE